MSTTRARLAAALKHCKGTGMWLVNAQLSTPWIDDAVAGACGGLPEWTTVILENHRRFGELPVIEWGIVTPTRKCLLDTIIQAK